MPSGTFKSRTLKPFPAGSEPRLNGAKAASVVHKQLADEAYADLLPILQQQRSEGASLQAIAEKLNGEGFTTRRGKEFTPMTIKRILSRTNDNEQKG